MQFSPVIPVHQDIQNEQLNDLSTQEFAERIVVFALGILTGLGGFFAALIMGAPLSFAFGAAILIGGSTSLIVYSTFQGEKKSADDKNPEFRKIQEEIDRQLELNAVLNQQLNEQAARREPEAVISIQKAVEEFNRKKAEFDEFFRTRNLDDPLIRKMYESQLFALNSTLSLSFTMATELLTPDAKARVLALYQAEYSYLMSLNLLS